MNRLGRFQRYADRFGENVAGSLVLAPAQAHAAAFSIGFQAALEFAERYPNEWPSLLTELRRVVPEPPPDDEFNELLGDA